MNEWTPIQEGRFHLRSMRPGEGLVAYVMRTWSTPPFFPGERRERMKRIAPLVRMARKERDEAIRRRRKK